MTPFDLLVLAFAAIVLGGTFAAGAYDLVEHRRLAWLASRAPGRASLRVPSTLHDRQAPAANRRARHTDRTAHSTARPAQIRAPRAKATASAGASVVQPTLFPHAGAPVVTKSRSVRSVGARSTSRAAVVYDGSRRVVARRLASLNSGR